MNITTHTIVKNEDHWLWYSLSAWKDFATKMLVFDDLSTDKTKEIVKSITSPNIIFETGRLLTPKDHTDCRNKMLTETKTDWFLLLDGDEIWNTSTIKLFLDFLSSQSQDIYAVGMYTRNLVGDIFHYLPESAGKYSLLGKTGHLTIRAYKKLPGFHWVGDYPLETYVDSQGTSINSLSNHLAFFDGFYWHTTHLQRSSSPEKVKGWRKKKLELGIQVKDNSQFPEVFSLPHPSFVPDPWTKMPPHEFIVSLLLTPAKKLRRRFQT